MEDALATDPPPKHPLSERQIEAAALLAKGDLTREQVAESVGRSRETIQKWLRQTEFRAYLDELVREHKDQVRRLLAYAARGAAATIINSLKARSERVRLEAAKIIFTFALGDPSKGGGVVINQLQAQVETARSEEFYQWLSERQRRGELESEIPEMEIHEVATQEVNGEDV